LAAEEKRAACVADGPLVSSPIVFCQRSQARCRSRHRGTAAGPTTPSAVREAPSTSAARNCATARPTAPATPTRTPRTAPTASRAPFSLQPMVESTTDLKKCSPSATKIRCHYLSSDNFVFVDQTEKLTAQNADVHVTLYRILKS
jgi:hypothetical protein